MILATCQCQHMLSWAQFTVVYYIQTTIWRPGKGTVCLILITLRFSMLSWANINHCQLWTAGCTYLKAATKSPNPCTVVWPARLLFFFPGFTTPPIPRHSQTAPNNLDRAIQSMFCIIIVIVSITVHLQCTGRFLKICNSDHNKVL